MHARMHTNIEKMLKDGNYSHYDYIIIIIIIIIIIT